MTLKLIQQELKILKKLYEETFTKQSIEVSKTPYTYKLTFKEQLQNPFYIIKSSPWPTILGLGASFLVTFFVFNILHTSNYGFELFLEKISNSMELSTAAAKKISWSDDLLKTLTGGFSICPITLIRNIYVFLYQLASPVIFYVLITFKLVKLSAMYALIWFFSTILPYVGISFFLYSVFSWFKDMVNEGTFSGQYTSYVQWNIRCGFLLFIASETMFFFGLFWTYFYSALSPSHSIGGIWPPKGIESPDPLGLPFLNTAILVYSGFMVNVVLRAIEAQHKTNMLSYLLYTIVLGLGFVMCQYYEYCWLDFNISDSVYGSSFYLTTGTHGLHVIIGLGWLIICLLRAVYSHFRADSYLGVELAAWYWHFVDGVWLFVYLFFYWWT